MELLPNAEYNESMKALIRQEPTLFSPSVGSCLIVNIVSSIQVCYTMFSIRISLLFLCVLPMHKEYLHIDYEHSSDGIE